MVGGAHKLVRIMFRKDRTKNKKTVIAYKLISEIQRFQLIKFFFLVLHLLSKMDGSTTTLIWLIGSTTSTTLVLCESTQT